MKLSRRSLLKLMPVAAAATVSAAWAVPASKFAYADTSDRIFDFTDAFYLQNGVNPAKMIGRRTGADGRSVIDTPFFPHQRNVRIIRLNTAYSHSGDLIFWVNGGDINVEGFTADAAGQRAKQLADASLQFVFPRRDQPDPVALGANRQSDILDLRNGYFSNNPLGLWLHVWISYTDAAFNSNDGKKMLADLQKKNGLGLDGTPIIKSISDIDNLISKGFATKRFRNPNGSEGFMYGICPVIKDPTKGGVAPDNFLNYLLKPDGSPLEPAFLQNFNSLKSTGNWGNK